MEESLTSLLNLAQRGGAPAVEAAFQSVYGRLKAIAGSLLGRERPGHSLQATGLVHEVFVQKLSRLRTPIQNREHFYSLSAFAMRQVLVDHARKRNTRERVTAEVVAGFLAARPAVGADDRLAARQVFEALARIDPAAAASIRYRVIDGLTIQETARIMGRPAWRVRADCDFGLDWMASRLRVS